MPDNAETEPDWDKDTNEACPGCGVELWFDPARRTYECPQSGEVYHYSKTEGMKSGLPPETIRPIDRSR